MKNSIFIFVLIAVLLAGIYSCSLKRYDFKLSQFKLYQKTVHPVSGQLLRKFNEGIYLFEICSELTVVNGITTEWYKICEDSLNEDIKQYAFLTFLDDYRAYYYTSSHIAPDDKKNSYCYSPNSGLPRSEWKNRISQKRHVKERFNIAYNISKNSMRGYYKVLEGYETGLESINIQSNCHPYETQYDTYKTSCQDTLVEVPVRKYRVQFELEKIDSKNTRVSILADLLVSRDSVKNDQAATVATSNINRLVIKEFRVFSEKDVIYRPSPITGPSNFGNYRTIRPDSVLLFSPTFRFIDKPVFYYWCDNARKTCRESERIYFNKIDFSKPRQSINYQCAGSTIFNEHFGSLKSW